jgi:hypothetical protein
MVRICGLVGTVVLAWSFRVVAAVTWPAQVLAQSAPATAPERLHAIIDRAAELPRLHALVVAQDGMIMAATIHWPSALPLRD